jgi:hypothetical protein
MSKTVYCNNCPILVNVPPNMVCGLTEYPLTQSDMFEWRQDEPDCPLKRLELKDGFVYVPEVVSD